MINAHAVHRMAASGLLGVALFWSGCSSVGLGTSDETASQKPTPGSLSATALPNNPATTTPAPPPAPNGWTATQATCHQFSLNVPNDYQYRTGWGDDEHTICLEDNWDYMGKLNLASPCYSISIDTLERVAANEPGDTNYGTTFDSAVQQSREIDASLNADGHNHYGEFDLTIPGAERVWASYSGVSADLSDSGEAWIQAQGKVYLLQLFSATVQPGECGFNDPSITGVSQFLVKMDLRVP